MLCENADPTVRRDLEAFMNRLAPDGDSLFEHTTEGPDDMAVPLRAHHPDLGTLFDPLGLGHHIHPLLPEKTCPGRPKIGQSQSLSTHQVGPPRR